MFTRGCLLGLLSVPATWLLAAWLAWTLSGPVAPGKPARPAAANSDISAAVPAVVQPGTAPTARPEVKIVIGADSSAAGPVTLHTLALQQCTRYLLDLVRARDGSADDRRPASCSRMLTAWTQAAMDHLVAVLGPFGAWTRNHVRSAREESCRGQTRDRRWASPDPAVVPASPRVNVVAAESLHVPRDRRDACRASL